MYSSSTDSRNFYIPTYQHAHVSESEDDFSHLNQHNTCNSATIIHEAKQLRKRKAEKQPEYDNEHILKKIKELADDDKDINKEIFAFYKVLLDKKRAKIGNVITWQQHDDDANKLALLDDNINVIMQARKAMMSTDDEGINITIEQWGWEDEEKIRPKYSITIKRLSQ